MKVMPVPMSSKEAEDFIRYGGNTNPSFCLVFETEEEAELIIQILERLLGAGK